MTDLFKLVVPPVVALLWLRLAFSRAPIPAKISTLYLLSVGVLSFNWSFYFRELHQTIHATVALLGAWSVMRRGVPRFAWGMLIFLAFIVVSLLSAGGLSDPQAVAQLVNFGLILLVACYFRANCWNTECLSVTLRFLAEAGFIIATFGLVEFVTMTEGRIEGPMSNPNYFGYYIGVTYIAAFATMRGLVRVITLVVMLVAITLSGSRAAYLFPIAHAAYYFFSTPKMAQKLMIAMAGAAAAAVLLASGWSRFSEQEQIAGSDTERIAFMYIAKDMADDYPLTGVGWGRFPAEFWLYAAGSTAVVYAQDREVDVSREERRVTHNDFLRVLAELGYIATGFAIGVLVLGAFAFWRGAVPAAAVMLPLWLGNLGFSLTHNNMNSALFWLFMLTPFYGALLTAKQQGRRLIQRDRVSVRA